MQSDLAVSAPGVYVEDVEISSDDFGTIAVLGAGATTESVTTAVEGDHFFRILGLFDTPAGTAPGPVSNVECVTVELACVADVVLSNETISSDRVVAACQTLTAAPDVVIESPAEVTFLAGQRIILGDGFRVDSGARFTARIDPSLLP
jgi:hypothetical protein